MTSLAASALIPSSPVASRWSTERAPSSIASGIAPASVNWSPWRRSARPASRHASRYRRACAGVEGAALEEDVGGFRDLGCFGKHLGEREVEIRVGVCELRRDGVRAEPGRDAARVPDRAQGRELGVTVEAVARLRLERRRAGGAHPVAVALDGGAQAALARARAWRGRWRGSRRRLRAAPRSSRRRLGARTPPRGRRRTPRACGSRRGPARAAGRARRARRRRRRASGRSRIRPTASIVSPSQRTKASSSTSTFPSAAPRNGASRPAGVASCARSRTRSLTRESSGRLPRRPRSPRDSPRRHAAGRPCPDRS